MHAQQIGMLQSNPIYSSVYGLKFDSPFNKLSHFHTSIMLSPNLMHDLLEDIVPMELKRLISSGYLNLQQLNAKIVSFKFGINDTANKPNALPINYEKGLKLNTSCTWCF